MSSLTPGAHAAGSVPAFTLATRVSRKVLTKRVAVCTACLSSCEEGPNVVRAHVLPRDVALLILVVIHNVARAVSVRHGDGARVPAALLPLAECSGEVARLYARAGLEGRGGGRPAPAR